jgi:serine protease AprX
MKKLLTVLLMFGALSTFAQVAPNKYYIEFTDKNNNSYSLDRPEEFLSERSLQRRANQGINLDMSDLPVTQIYVDSLESLGLDVINVSKWFNSATIYTLDSALIDSITYLSFVSNAIKNQPITGSSIPVPARYKFPRENPIKSDEKNHHYDYGASSDQIFMHNGQLLHNEGFRGQGMLIAVTDAGYMGLLDLVAFDSLVADGRIISKRDFVHGGDLVYDYSTHGMRVMSILAGNAPGNLIGSAPEADYLLLVSEDADSENFIEEINWLSAAEYADSMGADLINVSLGYLDFDTQGFDHNYQQMNGRTAIISVGATVAARKGMLVVAAAANSGDDEAHPWVNAPGDADSIITAGAVWSDQSYAYFSSIGPSSDGRVKPDLAAMGAGTTNQNLDGSFGTGNGTSFSAPLLTGMLACLWQKFPEKTNFEIIDAARQSAHLYNTPTPYLGYGIPDFFFASQILSSEVGFVRKSGLNVYPNPFQDEFIVRVDNNEGDSIQIMITDINGRSTYLWMEKDLPDNNTSILIDDFAGLKPGAYILTVILNTTRFSEKLIKE